MKYVSYFRVSTHGQSVSGLGLDAQRCAVKQFLNGTKPIAAFEEVESGKSKDRPELNKAIALCRQHKATLLIARLDRLARNAAFTLALRDSGVDFVCCDMPAADRFTIGLFALLAEKEAEMISERTKAGLAATKRRGTKLGSPKLKAARKLALAAVQRKAGAFAAKLAPVIEEIRAAGVTSFQGIADCLNRRGYRTPQGKTFWPQSVMNLVALLPS